MSAGIFWMLAYKEIHGLVASGANAPILFKGWIKVFVLTQTQNFTGKPSRIPAYTSLIRITQVMKKPVKRIFLHFSFPLLKPYPEGCVVNNRKTKFFQLANTNPV